MSPHYPRQIGSSRNRIGIQEVLISNLRSDTDYINMRLFAAFLHPLRRIPVAVQIDNSRSITIVSKIIDSEYRVITFRVKSPR
jgi:hypothetical protein